jgi:hypothetical protein
MFQTKIIIESDLVHEINVINENGDTIKVVGEWCQIMQNWIMKFYIPFCSYQTTTVVIDYKFNGEIYEQRIYLDNHKYKYKYNFKLTKFGDDFLLEDNS